MPPAKKLAIVTCMDARIDPFGAFGISVRSISLSLSFCEIANIVIF